MRLLAFSALSLLLLSEFSLVAKAQFQPQYRSQQSQSVYQLFQRGTTAAAFNARAAESIWQELIRQVPSNSAGYYYLGLALSEQDRFSEAEAVYRQSIQLNPRNAIAHYNLATVLSAQDKHSAADAMLRTAVNLYLYDAAAYCDLSNTLQEQYQFDAAMDAAATALEIDPDYAFAENLGLGSVCTLHRFNHTIGLLQAAARIEPNSPERHYRLGAALDRHERWEEAIAAYQSAIRLDTAYADAYLRMSATLSKLGRESAAASAYQAAITAKASK